MERIGILYIWGGLVLNRSMENAPKIRGMKEEKVAADAAELDRYGGKSLFYSYCFHFLLLLALLLLSLVITSLPNLKFCSDAQISLSLFFTVVLGIQGRGVLRTLADSNI